MTSDECLAGAEGVVVDRVYAVGPTMFDYDVVVNVTSPARVPRGKVVFKVQAFYSSVFRDEVGKPRFKIKVVISSAPEPLTVWGRLKEVVKILSYRF